MTGAGESAFTIRPATPEDEPELAEIQHASAMRFRNVREVTVPALLLAIRAFSVSS